MAMGGFAEVCPDVRKVKQLVSQLPWDHVILLGVGYPADAFYVAFHSARTAC